MGGSKERAVPRWTAHLFLFLHSHGGTGCGSALTGRVLHPYNSRRKLGPHYHIEEDTDGKAIDEVADR